MGAETASGDLGVGLCPERRQNELGLKFGYGRMQGQEHDNNFDLIRLLAAIQVVYSHGAEWLRLPLPPAPVHTVIFFFPGVAVFFVISGFLITQSFQAGGGHTVPFFARRASRIYPALFLNLLFIAALLLLANNIPWSALLSAGLWLWLALSTLLGSEFFGNLIVGPPYTLGGTFPVFPSQVLWTISAELGFYLLVPIVFIRSAAKSLLTLATIAVWFALSLLIACAVVLYRPYHSSFSAWPILAASPFPFFWMFLLGAAAHVYWDRLSRLLIGKAPFWLAGYIGGSFTLWATGVAPSNMELTDPTDPLVLARTFVLAGTVLSCAYTAPQLARVLRRNDISYGVYLYHMQAITILVASGVRPSPLIWIIVFAGTFGLAALSWHFVEHPILARKAAIERAAQSIVGVITGLAAGIRRVVPVTLPAIGRGALTVLAPIAALTMIALIVAEARSKNPGIETLAPIFERSGQIGGETLGRARAEMIGAETRLTGDDSLFGNQWRSAPIDPGVISDFVMRFEVSVLQGGMGIGILDAEPNGQWLGLLEKIQRDHAAVRFQTARPFRIVLFNNNPAKIETAALVRSISIAPVR